MKAFRIILCLFVVQISFGQNISFNKGEVITKNYYSEIQYEFVKGKIIIPVIIKGKTYQFLLDTGAPNLISSDLKNTLDKTKLKSISVKDANNNRRRMDLVTLPILSIGNIEFKEQTALVYELESNLLFDCFKIDGIIGSNLFRKSILKILSKEKKIIITNSIKKANPNKQFKSNLNLIGAQSSPYITIRLKGEKNATESLLFDTGMDGFYDLCLKHYNLFTKEKALTTHSKGEGSIGMSLFGNAKSNNQYRLKIPEINFPGATFKNVVTQTTDDDNSRIGSKLLNYGNVTIDFKHKDFYFEPFEKINDLDEKLLAFSPTILNNKVSVGIVWNDSLNKKISYGDEIISVNGINFSQMDICELLINNTVFKKEEYFEIKLKDAEGETKTINLTKQ